MILFFSVILKISTHSNVTIEPSFIVQSYKGKIEDSEEKTLSKSINSAKEKGEGGEKPVQIPNAHVGMMSGLLELIDDNGGKMDIIIDWGRYAELFNYYHGPEELYLDMEENQVI